MAICQVDCTSLMNRSPLFGAGSESQASERALRILRWLTDPCATPVARSLAPAAWSRLWPQDRPDHRWAARMGTE